jgi:hypothetical protein
MAAPKYEEEKLSWQTDDFSESWGVHFLHVDPIYDTLYVEEELLSWGCKIADQEQIWLRAAWPIETSDSFLRAGFHYSCVYFSELVDQHGKTQMLGMTKLTRRPRTTPSITESSSSSSSSSGNEDLPMGPYRVRWPN